MARTVPHAGAKVESTMTLVAYYQILCSIELNHENWRGALPLFKKVLTIKGIEQMPFVVYDCYNNMHEPTHAWDSGSRPTEP